MKFAQIELRTEPDKRINICVTTVRYDNIIKNSWIIGCENYKIPSNVEAEPYVDAVIKKLESRGFQVY